MFATLENVSPRLFMAVHNLVVQQSLERLYPKDVGFFVAADACFSFLYLFPVWDVFHSSNATCKSLVQLPLPSSTHHTCPQSPSELLLREALPVESYRELKAGNQDAESYHGSV